MALRKECFQFFVSKKQLMVLNLPKSRARIFVLVVPWVWAWKCCEDSESHAQNKITGKGARIYSNGLRPKPRTYMDSLRVRMHAGQGAMKEQ